jgi:hypothetical protein
MSPTHPLAPDIHAKLGTPFEKQVFDAALQSLDQTTNPLRLNHFATTLRELSRMVLNRLAPDAEVKACGWYTQAAGQPDITRCQRITYAVQAGLLDPFVKNTLLLDVDKMRQDLLQTINTLSKYTHVQPSVFGVKGQTLDMIVAESLEAFLAFLEMIEECREAVEHTVESHARQALHQELIRSTIQELDELATHYTVDGAHIETVTIRLMGSELIHFSVTGSVDCQLQYGSSSDVRNGDGIVMDDSYPLTCDFEAPIATPLQVAVKGHTLKIDNESFYK